MRFRSFSLIAVSVIALAARPAAAQDLGEKLQIHGSLNTAYAQSDDLPIFGISKRGTSDYRALALQFRYSMSDQDQLVVQFLNRRLGTSPLQAANPDVQINWAYWQHREGDWTIRVGKNPLPRGLLNEVRFVGSVLPMYRDGASVYGETLETVDGVTVQRRLDLPASFGMEATAFAGSTRIVTLFPGASSVSVVDTRTDRFIGGQTALTTPVPGSKLVGFFGHYTSGSDNPGSLNHSVYTYMLSGEEVQERWFARAEWTRFFTPASALEGYNYDTRQNENTDYMGWYAHAGVKPTDQLSFIYEYQASRVRIFQPSVPVAPGVNLPLFNVDVPFYKDAGVGASWAFTPTLVAKVEGHWTSGIDYDRLPGAPVGVGAPTATGIPLIANPGAKTRYLIISVATSF
jgi:hypothetical protein